MTGTLEGFFPGDSEMARRCREHDWSASSIGAPEGWPTSLATIVRTLLTSRHPMFLWWGPDLIQFYNDGFRPSLGAGGRHPAALGASGRDFWTEVWAVIGPQIDEVLAGGMGTWNVDQLIPIERNGRLEDVYWSYGYSAAHGDDGSIHGVLVVCQETTERVLAEREGRRIGERLSTVLENITDAFLTVDLDFRFTFVNAEAERVLGRTREELIGQQMWIAFPDLVGSQFELEYRRAFAENTNVRFESFYPAWNMWFNVSAYPSPEGLAVYFQDVTARRAMEERLRQNEQLIEVAGGTAHLGGWIVEVGSPNVIWSDEVCAIHGVPAGTAPTVEVAINAYAPEWRPVITEHFTACLLEGKPFDLDLQIVTASGELVWVRAMGVAIRDETGTIVRVQGAFQNIARQKATELALLESLENSRLLTLDLTTTLNAIGDGVISTDAEANITGLNPVAEQLTGWSSRDARGRVMPEVLHIIDEVTRKRIPCPVGRALAEGRVVALDDGTVLVRKDGSELPIADSCAPMKDAAGAISGAVLVFRDVSAERASQEKMKTIQKQLIMSDRMASVGTLAAGVAHEINNPLAYAITNLEMIVEEVRALRGSSTSSVFENLEGMARDAIDGAQRIRKIVRGLKTFSRADEERLTNIELVPVIEFSCNMAFNEIRHRARLVKDFSPTPFVYADDARLGQVFINLLVNAAQALPEGREDSNEIRIRTSTNAGGDAVIEVRDTGPGIPAAVIDRIFDPFFTTKGVGVGTGLGLSICRNIVTSIGGSITVASTQGAGTSFVVTLPRSTREAAPATVSSVPEAPPLSVSREVLVVDDEPAVGTVLRRLLRDHSVTPVTSAREALDLLSTGRVFDVIISDIMMPEMSGMDLYYEVLLKFPDMAERMVFVTGGAFTTAAESFLESVPNERLEKPFDLERVRALVAAFPAYAAV